MDFAIIFTFVSFNMPYMYDIKLKEHFAHMKLHLTKKHKVNR